MSQLPPDSSAPLDASGHGPFVRRHIGPRPDELDKMAAAAGYDSVSALVDEVVPPSIRVPSPSGEAVAAPSEREVLAMARELADENTVVRSLIGLGYHGTITPPVILRNILENPAWYTAYTPYQAEISQGRLEALLNFQTMISDLVGMEIANASMLDEGTAAAEVMTMARRATKVDVAGFFVDVGCHPQTIEVVQVRAEPLGIDVIVGDPATLDAAAVFGALLATPTSDGNLVDHTETIAAVHEAGGFAAVVTDPLAATVLATPGSMGADAVVGSAQRFGVPMGFGGPHAGFLATKESYRRSLPGRLVGVSVDSAGRPAYRLALQTREQHIRREKATSNICTSQVLLAVIASMYAVYHGPDGLREIASEVHACARRLAAASPGSLRHGHYFDTVAMAVGDADAAVAAALDAGFNIRRLDANTIVVSCDEQSTADEIDRLAAALAPHFVAADVDAADVGIADSVARGEPLLVHEVFRTYHSETEMLRYLRRLADRDIALDRSMIPLGSCTMKLNATTEMIPVTWPGFGDIHPFAPIDQSRGYQRMFDELGRYLCEITGYAAVSLQPNAGSQGEYAGLMAIRAYHQSRGDDARDVCLIPSSAHGTNAASAVMAGMRVIVVACDDNGNVDLDDLGNKLDEHAESIAALMVTYPSTHGVYEEAITSICDRVHKVGGQVYLDGANLNALIGLAKPGLFGSDVSHLNLHKTFCIPHGGGGPGVGPIGVREHLAPFLPSHGLVPDAGPATGVGAISAAPWGSASILPISWSYITLMGTSGLHSATEAAIVSANYVAQRLSASYPVLYSGRGGLVAHECILDIRPLERETGITAEDIAKRLIDYGFHAPTMSFPVAGTLMIEPTESEPLAELDRFCEAMEQIRAEIAQIASGEYSAEGSVLRAAPHPAEDVTADEWDRAYPRSLAAYPVDSLRRDKYWSPVSRIDNGYGDRNLVCACPPPEAFESS